MTEDLHRRRSRRHAVVEVAKPHDVLVLQHITRVGKVVDRSNRALSSALTSFWGAMDRGSLEDAEARRLARAARGLCCLGVVRQ